MFQEQREQQSGQQLQELLSALIEIYRAILDTNRILTDQVSTKLSDIHRSVGVVAQAITSTVNVLTSINANIQHLSRQLLQSQQTIQPTPQRPVTGRRQQPQVAPTVVPPQVPQPPPTVPPPSSAPAVSPVIQALVQNLQLERQKRELAEAFQRQIRHNLSRFRGLDVLPDQIQISRVIIPPGIHEIQPGIPTAAISKRFEVTLEPGISIPAYAVVSGIAGHDRLRSLYIIPELHRKQQAQQFQQLFTQHHIVSTLLQLYKLPAQDVSNILARLSLSQQPFTFTHRELGRSLQRIINDLLLGRPLITEEVVSAALGQQPSAEEYLRLAISTILASLPRKGLPTELREQIRSLRETLGLSIASIAPRGFKQKIRQAVSRHGEPPEIQQLAKTVITTPPPGLSEVISEILFRKRSATYPVYNAEDVMRLENAIRSIPEVPEGYTYILTKKVLSNILNLSKYHLHGEPSEELKHLSLYIQQVSEHLAASRQGQAKDPFQVYAVLQSILTALLQQSPSPALYATLHSAPLAFGKLQSIIKQLTKTVPGTRKKITQERLSEILQQIIPKFGEAATQGVTLPLTELEQLATNVVAQLFTTPLTRRPKKPPKQQPKPEDLERAHQYVLDILTNIHNLLTESSATQIPSLLLALSKGKVPLPRVAKRDITSFVNALKRGDIGKAFTLLATKEGVLSFVEQFVPQGLLTALGAQPGAIQRLEPSVLAQALSSLGTKLPDYLLEYFKTEKRPTTVTPQQYLEALQQILQLPSTTGSPPSTPPGILPGTHFQRRRGGPPVTPPATIPVTPPATIPVTPPATNPVTPPATNPVTPPATNPVTPPATNPVTPPATTANQNPAATSSQAPTTSGQPAATWASRLATMLASIRSSRLVSTLASIWASIQARQVSQAGGPAGQAAATSGGTQGQPATTWASWLYSMLASILASIRAWQVSQAGGPAGQAAATSGGTQGQAAATSGGTQGQAAATSGGTQGQAAATSGGTQGQAPATSGQPAATWASWLYSMLASILASIRAWQVSQAGAPAGVSPGGPAGVSPGGPAGVSPGGPAGGSPGGPAGGSPGGPAGGSPGGSGRNIPFALPPHVWQMLYEAAVKYQFPHLLRERRPETQTLESIRLAAEHVLPIIRQTFGEVLLSEFKYSLPSASVLVKDIYSIIDNIRSSSLFFVYSLLKQQQPNLSDAQLHTIAQVLNPDWLQVLEQAGIIYRDQKWYRLTHSFASDVSLATTYEQLRDIVYQRILGQIDLSNVAPDLVQPIQDALKQFTDLLIIHLKYMFSKIPLPHHLYIDTLREYVLKDQGGLAEAILKTQQVQDMHKALAGFAYSVFNIGQHFPKEVRQLFSSMSASMIPLLGPAFGHPIAQARLEREQLEKVIDYLSLFGRSLFYGSLSVIGFSKAVNRIAQSFPFHQVGYAIAYPTRMFADIEFFSRNIDKMIEYNQRMNELYAQRLQARELGYDIVRRISLAVESAFTSLVKLVGAIGSIPGIKQFQEPLLSSAILAALGTTAVQIFATKMGRPLSWQTFIPVGAGFFAASFAAQYGAGILDMLSAGMAASLGWPMAIEAFRKGIRTHPKAAFQLAPAVLGITIAPVSQAYGYLTTATSLNLTSLSAAFAFRPGQAADIASKVAFGVSALSTATAIIADMLNAGKTWHSIITGISYGSFVFVILRSVLAYSNIVSLVASVVVAVISGFMSYFSRPETDPMKIAESVKFP